MILAMTDHYRAARHLIDRAESAIERLHDEHQRSVPNKRAVAQLYDEITQSFNLGKIHAQLAVAQAITDQGIGR